MNNHRTIHDILSDWGKSKQKTPANNSVLKNKVLEKLPYNTPEIRVKTPLPWLSFAFTTMAILVIVGNSGSFRTNGLTVPNYTTSSNTYNNTTVESSGQSKTTTIVPRDYYPRDMYIEESPISDRREFLKTYYNSTLRTRHVGDLKTKIEIMVRGFGGRVDASSSAELYGYISFAIPTDKFEIFKQEIKSLVGKKLYIEQISSENLLPQKQSIEKEELQTEKYIYDLKSERKGLINNHNQIVGQLGSKISTINTEIAKLEVEWQTATPQRKTEINSKIAELKFGMNTTQKQLENENKNYQNKLANLDNQIKNTEVTLETIKKQDKNLIETVATVNGSISLNWISFWEMSDIYTPGPLLAWILCIAALASYLWHRRYIEINI